MLRFTCVSSALIATFFLSACGAAPPPPPPDPKAETEFGQDLKRRDALRDTFAQAVSVHRQRCELSAGDCRLEVNDGRDAILRAHRTEQCRTASDSDAELECVAKQLMARHEFKALSDYYRLDSWCLERLVACTAKMRDDASIAEQKSRYSQRKDRILESREGVAARALLAFAEERVAYVRAVLPPQADAVCKDSDREKCQAATEELGSQFEAELRKEDGDYNDSSALGVYQKQLAAQARCREPEFICLAASLDTYGGTAESRKLLAQSLKTLERRQGLVVEVGADDAEPCLNQGLQKHQSRIVSDYQRFAREPVLFFQSQLHNDFRAMYDSQFVCLQALRHPRPQPLATAAPAPTGPSAARSPKKSAAQRTTN